MNMPLISLQDLAVMLSQKPTFKYFTHHDGGLIEATIRFDHKDKNITFFICEKKSVIISTPSPKFNTELMRCESNFTVIDDAQLIDDDALCGIFLLADNGADIFKNWQNQSPQMDAENKIRVVTAAELNSHFYNDLTDVYTSLSNGLSSKAKITIVFNDTYFIKIETDGNDFEYQVCNFNLIEDECEYSSIFPKERLHQLYELAQARHTLLSPKNMLFVESGFCDHLSEDIATNDTGLRLIINDHMQISRAIGQEVGTLSQEGDDVFYSFEAFIETAVESCDLDLYEIERDNERNLRFFGVMLCSVSSRSGNPPSKRWTQLEMFITEKGKLVAVKRGQTDIEDEQPRCTAKVIDSVDDILDFFGYGRLSKQLYYYLSIDVTDEIE